MNKVLKAVSVALAFIFSVAVAAAAGIFLAAWDTNNLQTVYAMIRPTTVQQEKTHQVTKKTGNIKDAVDGFIDKGAQAAGFDDIFLPGPSDEGKEVKETENIPIKDALSASSAPASTDNSTAANTDVIDLTAPVAITDEISGISKIVRAGDKDDVIVNTHVNTINQQTTVSTGGLTLDPIASYPLPFTTVDMSYFQDALFIGDSRMQGLGMYSKINATFYAATAFQLYQYKTFKVVQTPEGKVPIFDAMPYDAFTKIYIKVGLNEMGMSDAAFIDVYTQFINELRIMQPRAIIYIHAILPVTASKSQSDRTHNNGNIARRNAVLKDFAEVMKCYFVDVGPYVSDETGALMAGSAADGIHMSGKNMPLWVQGLCEQAVVWPQ